MKTFTIHLESHDDVASTLDKLSWRKGRRFLLVWPKRSRLLQSTLDLVRIQRYCNRMGAQLGIVTNDPEVAGNATYLGIPVFESTAQAHRSIWRRSRNRKRFLKRIPSKRQRLLELKELFHQREPTGLNESRFRKPVFITGICAVAALLFSFLPSAEISLAMAEREQTVSIDIKANPATTAPDISGSIPAHTIHLEVEGQGQAVSTGSIPFPDQYATGVVTVTNLTGQPLIVPAGTVVMTVDEPPVRFVITEEIRIPGGVGASSDGTIRAEKPGQTGNVDSGRVRAISGGIGSAVRIQNPEPTSGGTDIVSPAPSAEDYGKLKKRVLDDLEKEARMGMERSLAQNQRLLPNTLQLVEIIEENLQPEVGQPGDPFTLHLRARYSADYILPGDVEAVVRTIMESNLEPGMTAIPDQTIIIVETEPDPGSDGMEWKVTASRMIRAAVKEEEVGYSVSGKKPEAAVSLLTGWLKLAQPPEIRMHPSWWPRIPYLPIQIRVEIR